MLYTAILCRIGSVFTKEAVAQLESEGTHPTPKARDTDVTQDQDKKSGVSCGGLLWQMAWCPLLQVVPVHLAFLEAGY